jgi:predicted NBD/HSP70 family sugar kinase
MVYLKIASGVGSGLVLDDHVYRGGLGTAGEIGHMTMDENGPLCRCGSRGCLEAYVGGFSLVSQLAPLQPDLTMAGLVELVRAEDVGARRLVEDAGRYLGRAAAMIANLIGPELIVLGGELAAAGDLLLDGIGDGLRRHALEPVEREVRVARASLGDQSSAVGALLLALDAVELPT